MIDPEELAVAAGMLMPFFVAVQGEVGEEAQVDALLPASLEVDDLRGFEFAVARWSDGLGLEIGRIAIEHIAADVVAGQPGSILTIRGVPGELDDVLSLLDGLAAYMKTAALEPLGVSIRSADT
jgi:hypothetical protein